MAPCGFKQLCVCVCVINTFSATSVSVCTEARKGTTQQANDPESSHTCAAEPLCCDSPVLFAATNNKCEAAVCECDRAAAHCFAEHPYNPEYKNLGPEHCLS